MAELSTLARPYAKAAFEYAVAGKNLKGWSNSLKILVAVCQNERVLNLLSSPSSTSAQKAKLMTEICDDEINEETKGFVSVLAENKRLKLLPHILKQFEALKDNREKTIDVDVVSAIKLSDKQKNTLASALSAKLEREVNMQVSVDTNLIGGAVIRAGDTVIDGSICGRLTTLAQVLHS
jgi:F-type H+-transporting ATPase subunit delta